MRIAYQGEPGAFSEAAARCIDAGAQLVACRSFEEVFASVEATYDTAGSAKLVKEHNFTDAAAIASERAAQVFGLDILRAEIQDYADNITRFLVIGRRPMLNTVPDKKQIRQMPR